MTLIIIFTTSHRYSRNFPSRRFLATCIIIQRTDCEPTQHVASPSISLEYKWRIPQSQGSLLFRTESSCEAAISSPQRGMSLRREVHALKKIRIIEFGSNPLFVFPLGLYLHFGPKYFKIPFGHYLKETNATCQVFLMCLFQSHLAQIDLKVLLFCPKV